MQKWITFLMTFLVGSASYVNGITGEVDFKAGYRHDNIGWKNQFPSSNPTFKTNTRFKNMDIFQIGLNARAVLGCNFYARAEADWGWILDGDFKDSFKLIDDSHFGSSEGSDFLGSVFEASRSSTFDDKYTYDANIAIGYAFWFCDCSAFLAPVIGYAVDVQNINIDDVAFGFGSCGFESGTACCKHKFFNRWYGPFVGVDFEYRPYHDCFNLYATLEYHWGTFKGKRNGGDDISLFGRNNHSDMTGWVFDIGAEYDICNCWTVGLDLTFKDFSASRRSRFHGFLGSFSGNDHVKHNQYWNSYAVSLTFGRQF